MPPISSEALRAALPPPWNEPLAPLAHPPDETVVMLDDDPTGTQTLHDVPVLTTWDKPTLCAEMTTGAPLIVLLTNTRSLDPQAAITRVAQLGAALREAAHATGRTLRVICRGDSTLRGHFPAELHAIEAGLGQRHDRWLLVPYFGEGGRITVNGVHYVQEGDAYVPAAETPYARDAAFGYTSSDLRAWVDEKTHGDIPSADVRLLSLSLVRTGGPQAVRDALAAPGGAVAVADVVDDRDLDVLVRGVRLTEADGLRLLCRSAASFVRVYAGLPKSPLLDVRALLGGLAGPGLVVVGSYVPKTTEQLNALFTSIPTLVPVTVSVAALLHDDASHDAEVVRASDAACRALRHGRTPVVVTSRDLHVGVGGAASLDVSARVSAALVAVARAAAVVGPRYVVAKGGITSSDTATAALGVRRAWVLGQAAPGVPVWRLGPESALPGVPYVVFPGNVGGTHTLADVVMAFEAARP